MTDRDVHEQDVVIADRIKRMVNGLNEALTQAYDVGLHVRMSVTEEVTVGIIGVPTGGIMKMAPSIHADIVRPL